MIHVLTPVASAELFHQAPLSLCRSGAAITTSVIRVSPPSRVAYVVTDSAVNSAFPLRALPRAPPAIADVRHSTVFDHNAKLGTAYIPAAADVRTGVNVDAASGTCHVPARADVRSGVAVDVSDTGQIDLPAASDVRSGVAYDHDTKTGTYEAPACDYPEITDVRDGVEYDHAAWRRWRGPRAGAASPRPAGARRAPRAESGTPWEPSAAAAPTGARTPGPAQ